MRFDYLSLMVLVLGIVMYFPPWKNPKVVEAGRICLLVGLLVTVWLLARSPVRLP